MLRNRYIGRSSSLSLFIPDSSSHNLFLRYFKSSTPHTLKIQQNDYNHNQGMMPVKEPICDINQPQSNDPRFLHNFQPSYVGPNIELPDLPKLPLISAKNFSELLLTKLNLCKVRCNFNYQDADKQAKIIKQETLMEILDLVSSQNNVRQMSEKLITEIVDMCFSNLKRKSVEVDKKLLLLDEIPVTNDPEMCHIGIVYQILDHSLKAMPHFHLFDFSFISQILKQLESPDPDERNHIYNIVCDYLHFHENDFDNVFVTLSNYLNGHLEFSLSPFSIHTALEIMYNIFLAQNELPGYYDIVFSSVILPLLGNTYEPYFNDVLSNFIMGFVSKRIEYCPSVIISLVKYWPETKNEKQCNFIKLLSMIISITDLNDLQYIIKRASQLFAMTIESESMRVAMTSITELCDPMFASILKENSSIILPIVYPALSKVVLNHWAQCVRESAKTALFYLRRVNPKVYKDLIDENSQIGPSFKQDPKLQQWGLVCRAAAANDNSINIMKELTNISHAFTSRKRNLRTAFPYKSQETILGNRRNSTGSHIRVSRERKNSFIYRS